MFFLSSREKTAFTSYWGQNIFKTGVFFYFLVCLTISAKCNELTTRYAVVTYDTTKQLQQLNNNLFLGREMSYDLRQRKIITIEDEIAEKIDIIIEKAESVSDMRPKELHFNIHLFSSANDAQSALYKRYNKRVDYISFYSRRDNLVYLSVKDASLRVIAHEFGHVVVEHFFNRAPPVQMHEVMAQYVESHITD